LYNLQIPRGGNCPLLPVTGYAHGVHVMCCKKPLQWLIRVVSDKDVAFRVECYLPVCISKDDAKSMIVVW